LNHTRKRYTGDRITHRNHTRLRFAEAALRARQSPPGSQRRLGGYIRTLSALLQPPLAVSLFLSAGQCDDRGRSSTWAVPECSCKTRECDKYRESRHPARSPACFYKVPEGEEE